MHFLIDADTIIYKAGFANEVSHYVYHTHYREVGTCNYKKDIPDNATTIGKERFPGPLRNALANAKSILERIINRKECNSYTIYVGGTGNFRYDLYPDYKGERSPDSKPLQYEEIKRYLIKTWQAVEVNGEEVDDRVSIEQTRRHSDGFTDTCIVSIDKDLDNTEGWHYNYDKDELYYVPWQEALFNFYKQMLTGDRTDNIPGLPRVGSKTADKILEGWQTWDLPEFDLANKVLAEYKKRGFDKEYFLLQGRLLHMRTYEGELWEPLIEMK